MPRPPVKSTKALTKAKLETEAKFKLSKKGIESALVDMINRVDPIELMAVTCGTFVVYDIVKSIPELSARAADFLFTPPIGVAWPILSVIIDRLFGDQDLTSEQIEELRRIRDTPDFFLFIKSFFISYILIKHSGQIIAGVGNITGFISTFLGLKVV